MSNLNVGLTLFVSKDKNSLHNLEEDRQRAAGGAGSVPVARQHRLHRVRGCWPPVQVRGVSSGGQARPHCGPLCGRTPLLLQLVREGFKNSSSLNRLVE